MDLDEWELILSDDEFLEIYDNGGNNILSRRKIRCGSNPTDFMSTNNYFISPISNKFSDPILKISIPNPTLPAKQIVDDLLPVQLETMEEMGSDHDGINTTTIVVVNSQISFKEMMRKNEFVDMKLDSPESSSSSRTNGGRRLKIWKWSSTGIGAICSFGVAAATVCFIVFANVNVNGNGNNHHPHQKKKNNKRENMNQKHLCFKIHGDDKVWT